MAVFSPNSDVPLDSLGYTLDDKTERVMDAIIRTKQDYGRNVSVAKKKKILKKYGSVTAAMSTGTAFTMVGTLQGSEVLETYATGNTIDSLACTDNDFAGDIYIEGQTEQDYGWDFSGQIVTSTGFTAATLDPPLIRASRMIDLSTNEDDRLASDKLIYLYDSSYNGGTTVSSGVPSEAKASKLIMSGRYGKTQKCATSLSHRDFWFIESVEIGVSKKTTASGLAYLRVRRNGHIFIVEDNGSFSNTTGPYIWRPDNLFIVPPMSDIEACVSDLSADAIVYARIEGYLAIDMDRLNNAVLTAPPAMSSSIYPG